MMEPFLRILPINLISRGLVNLSMGVVALVGLAIALIRMPFEVFGIISPPEGWSGYQKFIGELLDHFGTTDENLKNMRA